MQVCAQQGLISTLAFPKQLSGRGIEDPEMLQWWNSLGVMLLTSDSRMADEHTRFFPNSHKGVVVICNAGRPSLGHAQMTSLLSVFKQLLPSWAALPLDNAILEIWHGSQDHDLCISRARDGAIEWRESFLYATPDWQQDFLEAVARAGSN